MPLFFESKQFICDYELSICRSKIINMIPQLNDFHPHQKLIKRMKQTEQRNLMSLEKCIGKSNSIN